MFLKAETFSKLPSQLLKITNDLAAYQVDDAVLFFGLTIKNALQERVKGIGGLADDRQKYTLTQLLDDDFRLPASASGTSQGASQGGYKEMAMAYPRDVGRWKQVA